MPTTTQRFHDGARVIIDGLKLERLNGTYATVLSFDSEADRFRIECDDGEKVRVRPQNLFPVTESAQEPSTSAPASSSSAPKVDATIFVQGDRFVLPGVTPPPRTEPLTTNSTAGTTHRIPLPPGHWELRLIEHDPTSPLVRITLVAVGKKVQGEDENDGADQWSELVKGYTCTRTIDLSEEHDAERLSAEVKESVLEVSVPKICDDDESTATQEPVTSVAAAPPAPADEAVLSDLTAETVNAFDGRASANAKEGVAEAASIFTAKAPPLKRVCSAEAKECRRPGRLRRMRSAGAAMPSKRASAGSRRRAWKAAVRETVIAMEA